MLHSESEPIVYELFRFMCGVCTHLLCAGFIVFMAFLAQPGSSLFSWHPFLMTVGFLLFMTEAILIFSPHSSPVSKLKHQTKARVHWVLQSCCLCCAILGLCVIFYNKQLHSKPHFSTWHGLIGLLSVCMVAMQSVGALPLLYHKLRKGWSLAKLKRYHAASGLLTYLLGCTSLVLGLCSSWYVSSVNVYVWYLTALCPTVAGLVIMNQVTSAYLTKKRLQS